MRGSRWKIKLWSALALVVICAACTPIEGDIAAIKEKAGVSKNYTVTFNSNGGSEVPAQTVAKGARATEPQGVTHAGHTLDNWYSDAKLTTVYDFSAKVTKNITLYAKWNANPPNTFTVTFNSNGGNYVPDQAVTIGGKAAEPNVTRDHHTLDGWYTDNDTFLYRWNFDTNTVTGDIILYAKWNVHQYTVTFETSGGTPIPARQTVDHGGTVTEPEGVTFAGHTLGGWYTDNHTFANRWNFDADTVISNITLYAKWNANPPNTFTVTFVSNGGTPVSDQAVIISGNAAEPGVTRTNYTLAGWYTDNAFANRWNFATDIVSTNTTLYAKWTLNRYTITFESNGGTPVPAQQTVDHGGKVTEPEGITKDFYLILEGWYTDNDTFENRWDFNASVTGDITLYAKWDVVPLNSVIGLAEKLAWLQIYAQSNGNYTCEVNVDESIEPHTLSYNDRSNVSVTLKGIGANQTISLSSSGMMFRVTSGVTLVLDNNITLQGHSNNTDSMVRVSSGGTLVMNTGSTITGNTANGPPTGGTGDNSGGVYVLQGTFTMNGGKISGNTTSSIGGGVYVYSGTFTMNGGEITGNTANGTPTGGAGGYASGGGVYVGGYNRRATFTMTGGKISGNTSSSLINSVGGVCVDDYGTFEMKGGEISGNTSTDSFGGVFVNVLGTFTMSGTAKISGNTGGGVCTIGTFTMNGGTISGNTSSTYGGGVYVNILGGTFTKTNGTIYGYDADDTGNSNVVKDSSGTVVNNQGHAVYVYVNSTTNRRRETTAGETVNLDSTIAGAEGGWEN